MVRFVARPPPECTEAPSAPPSDQGSALRGSIGDALKTPTKTRSRRRRRVATPRSPVSQPRRYAGAYGVDSRGVVVLLGARRQA